MAPTPGVPAPADPVFISYRQADGTEITAELAWLLRAAGIPVWRDRDDLPPGDTDARLKQAIDAGISGAVFVVTPDIANSRIVKQVEAPRLVTLHEMHVAFALAIANAVTTAEGGTDYDAPDRLLERPSGSLRNVDQHSADRAGLLAVIRGMVWHRIASSRERVRDSDETFRLSVQTRNTPQVYDRTGDELDIRIRPSTHERLPSAEGLRDLQDVIGLLPDAVTRSGATRVRVRGGAHLSVAFAIGAAIPASRVGVMEIVDQEGAPWASSSAADEHPAPHLRVEREGGRSVPDNTARPNVAIYVDMDPVRSDAAFDRLLEETGSGLVEWRHVVSANGRRIRPVEAGDVAQEIAQHIRGLSYANNNALVHVVLRCPFPLASLVGRLTNTLRCVVYEWDDSEGGGGTNFRARYVPTLRIRASAANGAIEEVLLA
ncbi:SAVED domain-containing protein [Demequina sp.]|uniref:SAVED domain-containing protein n=1 Tax=Demequina sp. TaxID=2050685 RepID=UPI003D10A65C